MAIVEGSREAAQVEVQASPGESQQAQAGIGKSQEEAPARQQAEGNQDPEEQEVVVALELMVQSSVLEQREQTNPSTLSLTTHHS